MLNRIFASLFLLLSAGFAQADNVSIAPPSNGLFNSITVNGRTYSSTPGVAISVPDFDAALMYANGWYALPYSPLPTAQLFKPGINPAIHMANFLASKTPTVCGVGDSTWSSADNVALNDLTGAKIQQALTAAYPDKTITFKDFSFAGRSLQDFTTVVSNPTYPSWYTNTSLTWASYVQAANCTMIVWDFGLNSAGYDSAQSYQTVFQNLATWTLVPDLIWISNIVANPAAGTPYNQVSYQLGYRQNAALLRTLVESGSTLGVARIPPMGLLDIGRYFEMAINGNDPAVQSLSFVVPPSAPVTAAISGTASGTTFAFPGSSPGGDFDLTFTFNNGASFTNGNYWLLCLDYSCEDFIIYTYGGGNILYVNPALAGGSTTLGSVVTTWNTTANSGQNTMRVTMRGARLTIYGNGCGTITCAIYDVMIPRSYGRFTPSIIFNGNAPVVPNGTTITTTQYSVGTPKPYAPILSAAACYGSPSGSSSGNGINHVSSLCLNTVHAEVIEQAFSLPAETTTLQSGIAAAGTTQATAAALAAKTSVVTSVASGSGVILPLKLGKERDVYNRGTNALLIYPPSGAAIESNTANASVSLAAGGHATFKCVSATQCYQSP